MSHREISGAKVLVSADHLHEFASLIVGFPMPRSWVRKLSLNKRKILCAWIQNQWALANNNNVRKIPKPHWIPDKYIWGHLGRKRRYV